MGVSSGSDVGKSIYAGSCRVAALLLSINCQAESHIQGVKAQQLTDPLCWRGSTAACLHGPDGASGVTAPLHLLRVRVHNCFRKLV